MEQPPSYGWDELGSETYYHKYELYKLGWHDIDLAEVLLAGALYGGAIAITRDDQKFQKYRGQSNSKGAVQIYNCAGELLRDIQWQTSIKGLGWVNDEDLLIVSVDGTVRQYDLLGNFSQFSLSKSLSTDQVVSCKFWSSGLVVQLSNNTFIRVDDLSDPHPHIMINSHVSPETLIHSWTLVPPEFTLSRRAECLIAVDSSLISLDGTESQDLSLEQGPFSHISVAPNGQFSALRSVNGKIWVCTSDFQKTLTTYDAGVDYVPTQLEWCGNDAVVSSDGSFITLIGPSGSTLRYVYDSNVIAVPDVDGIRLFNSTHCEYLRKVPDTTERIFAPGSTSAASVLLDAIQQLDAKSAKAEDNIKLINAYLVEAVDDCIKAAGESNSFFWQKQLLRSASFGKGSLEVYNSDEFVEMCEAIRIMNALRAFEIGIALTLEQYIRLSPEKVISRLLCRRQHYLAARICTYLRIASDEVFVHWACLKLQSSNEDAAAVSEAIVQKLGTRKFISYVKIAQAAFADGRVDLAKQLLEHDPRTGAQVSLLLDMGQEDLALQRAVDCGDTDLLSHVVFHIKKSQPLATFFRMISAQPTAVAILVDYAKKHDIQLLMDYYYQDDRKLEGADLVLHESLQGLERPQQYSKAKLALKMLVEAREQPFEVKILEDHARLLQLQDSLTKEYGITFVDLPVAQILLKLIAHGHLSRAQKIASSFKIPDVIFTWLQLRAFINQRDWQTLEKWVFKMKKAIIPFETIATQVHGSGNTKLAAQIVTKCVSSAVRIETYMKLQNPLQAGREAYKIKDIVALQRARDVASEGHDIVELNDLLKRLTEP